MKSTMKFVCVAGGAALALGLGAANAEAAPQVERSYNLTAGKFNGKACTGEVPKVVEDLSGNVYSGSIGGSYQLDAGMAASCSTLGVQWVRIDDGTHGGLKNNFASGSGVLLIVSNDATTRVDVNANGRWDAR